MSVGGPLNDAREEYVALLFDAWTELRGYVQAAVEDGLPLDAPSVLAYMDELKARARQPMRAALATITDPSDKGSSSAPGGSS